MHTRNTATRRVRPVVRDRRNLLRQSSCNLPESTGYGTVGSEGPESLECSLPVGNENIHRLLERAQIVGNASQLHRASERLSEPSHRSAEQPGNDGINTNEVDDCPLQRKKRRCVDPGLCQNSFLPAGCAIGTPIPIALPAVRVEEFSSESAMIRSIQNDNFKFLRHMILLGWMSTSPCDCNFAVTVDGSVPEEPEVLRITSGTPLHYAICCGSLEAASALIIAFPDLAKRTCTVMHLSRGQQTSSRWSALDFASYFCNLYLHRDAGRHEAFRKASVILLTLQQNPSALAFMQHSSPAERLKGAGHDVQRILETFFTLAD